MDDSPLFCLVAGEIPALLSPNQPKIDALHQDQHEDLDLDALLKLERLKEKELTEIEKDEQMGKEEAEVN